ncbi:uncharacterized protein [Clytia hemisphaerica]|uniref:Cnidarian restricted protein n=1 Tax=Clytia hemisphaerica TaxID=252671 RepID=A0A7M5XG83_9CNID
MKGVSFAFFVLSVLAVLAYGRYHRHLDDVTSRDIEEYLESKYGLKEENEDFSLDEDDDENEVLRNSERFHDPRARWTSWRPRIGGMIKRNIIVRALKPSCAGCAGICERKVAGRCACVVDQRCIRQRYGKK